MTPPLHVQPTMCHFSLQGGGEVLLRVPIVKQLLPISLTDEGMVKRIRGVAYSMKVGERANVVGVMHTHSMRLVPPPLGMYFADMTMELRHCQCSLRHALRSTTFLACVRRHLRK